MNGPMLAFTNEVRELYVIDHDLACLVIERMAEGVCLVRVADASIVYANPRFEAMLGYGPGELEGRPVEDINHPLEGASPNDVARSIIERLDREGEATYEVRNRKKDGSSRWCRARTTAFEHPELGTVWVAVHQPIDAEKELGRREELLRTVAESLPVGLWITDAAGRIEYGNARGQEIWRGARYVGVESYGEYRGWWEDTGEPIAAEEWALARALRNRESSIGELVRIQCFDGTFKTILNSAVPLFDEAGEVMGAIVVNEDVTDLKDAIDARDHLLTVVAHDLRGPLQGVALYGQMLAKDLERASESTEKRARWLTKMRRALRQMNTLIDDLVDLGRLEQGAHGLNRTSVDPGDLVREVIELAETRAGERRVRAEVDGSVSAVAADRARLLQALGNLVDNAIKFTEPGDEIAVGVEQRAGEVRLFVRDTGPGIPADQLPRLFQRHWQGRPGDRRGAGIGLAIVREIATAHGGRAWVESRPGDGATFVVSVPIADDPVASPG